MSTHIGEMLLMSTHNVCFLWRNKKKYEYFLVEKKHLIWSYELGWLGWVVWVFAIAICPMAPDKAAKSTDICLISARKHMLWYSLEVL